MYSVNESPHKDTNTNTSVFLCKCSSSFSLLEVMSMKKASECMCVCTWACCVLLDEGRGLETIGPKMSSSSWIGPSLPEALPPPSGVSDREKIKLKSLYWCKFSVFIQPDSISERWFHSYLSSLCTHLCKRMTRIKIRHGNNPIWRHSRWNWEI